MFLQHLMRLLLCGRALLCDVQQGDAKLNHVIPRAPIGIQQRTSSALHLHLRQVSNPTNSIPTKPKPKQKEKQKTTTMMIARAKQHQPKERTRRESLLTWLKEKYLSATDPMFAPLFYHLGRSKWVSNAFLIQFAKNSLNDLKPKGIDIMLTDSHSHTWLIGRHRLQRSIVHSTKAIFDRLPPSHQAAIVRHVFRNMPQRNAASLVRDLPKNGLKRMMNNMTVREQMQLILSIQVLGTTHMCRSSITAALSPSTGPYPSSFARCIDSSSKIFWMTSSYLRLTVHPPAPA